MAKAKVAGASKPKRKNDKPGKAVALKADSKKGKKSGGKRRSDGIDALWRLADHPMVGELLAIGATAAVAAIAEQGLGKNKKPGNARAVKQAGKAAAAAIGARLISEFAEGAGKKPKSAKA